MTELSDLVDVSNVPKDARPALLRFINTLLALPESGLADTNTRSWRNVSSSHDQVQIHFDIWSQFDEVMKKHLKVTTMLEALRGLDPRTVDIVLNQASALVPSHLAAMLSSMRRYEDCGQQTFVVGPRMAEAFSTTKLSEIFYSDLAIPHDTFWLALPNSGLRLWGGERTGWHRVVGMYVSRIAGDNGEEGIRVTAWGEGNDDSFGTFDDAVSWFQIQLRGQHELRGNATSNAYIHSLEKQFENLIEESQTCPPATLESEFFQQGGREHADTMMSLSRIAINLILYLVCSNCELESHAPDERDNAARNKRRTLRKKGVRASFLPSGATVTHVGRLLEMKLDENPSSGSRVRRHVRRGHWHHYWVGPRTNETGVSVPGTRRVRKFVAQTVVNRDVEQSVTKRTYKITPRDHSRVSCETNNNGESV